MTIGKSLVEDMARAIHESMDITDSLDPQAAERYAEVALSVLKDRLPADDRELVERLRLFQEVYAGQRGLPWIGTVRPEQAFEQAADRITSLSASRDETA